MCRDLVSAYYAAQRGVAIPQQETNATTKWVGTPPEAVEAMLSILSPLPGKLLCDPGCGDGRILIAGTKNYSTLGVGIEINEETARLARSNVIAEGLSSKVKVTTGSCLNYSYGHIDYVALFLFDDLIAKLFPLLEEQLPLGAKVISYSHELPNSVKIVKNNHTFYLWTKQ